MAQPEQGGRGDSTPDNLHKTKRQWSGELGGPHWPEIKQWHAQKLGRAIGADIYAIRHTTGNKYWHDDRVLLLFPNTQTTDLCLVGPQVSQSTVPHERDMQDEGYRSDFIAQFSPSQHAYRHPSWQPEEGMTAFESFLRNASSFSVVVHKRSFSNEERGTIIDEALTNAKALQEKDRVRNIDITSGGLIDVLDPDGFGFLAGLEEQFAAQVEASEGSRLRRDKPVVTDPDDIIKLYEDLHRIENGEGL